MNKSKTALPDNCLVMNQSSKSSGHMPPRPIPEPNEKGVESKCKTMCLLDISVLMFYMQCFIRRVINGRVFANKKYCAFLVTKSGIEPFYESVGDLSVVRNFPEDQGGRWIVEADVVHYGFQGLLSRIGQKCFAVFNGTDTQRCDDVAAFEYGVESNVSRRAVMDRGKEALNHGVFPMVVEGSGTAVAIFRALNAQA
jgi:hypothetical protein